MRRLHWHLRLSDEFEQTPGDGGGQGSLVPCSLWGHRFGQDLATKQQTAITKERHPKEALPL